MCSTSDNPMLPGCRRFLTRLLLRLSTGLVTALLSSTAVASQDAGEESEVPRLAEGQTKIAASTVYGWVFGANASGATEAGKYLETILGQRIAVVDQVCKLTDAQKEKLQLAGRGDIKRFIDRVEEIGSQFQVAKRDDDKAKVLRGEAELLKRTLTSWLSNDDSLFLKTLQKVLTAEQFTSYDPLRAVYRAGGIVRTRCVESNEVLEIYLTGTSVSDAALAPLSKLPRLDSLFLGNTQLTDARLRHLKRLTSLRKLWLDNTDVTDAEIAELESAIPGLTVDAGVMISSGRGASQVPEKSLTITIASAPNGHVGSVTVGLAKLFDGPLDSNRLRMLDRRLKDAFAIDGAIDQVLLRVGTDVAFSELNKVIAVCARQKNADGKPINTISFVAFRDQAAADMSRKQLRVGSAPPVKTENEDLIVLNVDSQGELSVGGTTMEAEPFLRKEAAFLKKKLKADGKTYKDGDELPTAVVIRADPETPFAVINTILTECQKNGFWKFALSERKTRQ